MPGFFGHWNPISVTRGSGGNAALRLGYSEVAAGAMLAGQMTPVACPLCSF